MRTRKPISTISYNSPEFLIMKLEELRRCKIISVWFFISHKPEEDETKEHIHLYIEPSKQILTDDLVSELCELDVNNPNKPKKCLSFRSSSFADWYLYAIHDKDYLLRKGQKRKYHYLQEEIVASDTDELDYLVRQIDMTDYSAYGRLINAFEQGLTFSEFFRRGCIPIQQIRQYQLAWELLASQNEVSRNGRENSHE